MDEVERFEWVARSGLGEAACVTLVEDTDVERVARRFGGLLDEAWQSPPDAFPDGMGELLVALRRVGGWVVAVEVNGYQGAGGVVLRRITKGTRAVSAFWNVNADTCFSYAADGRVLTSFDMVSPHARHGADPGCLDEIGAGLPWAELDWVPTMLALAARVTGQVFAREWMDGEFTVVPLMPWQPDVPDQVYPRYERLTYDEPTLARALCGADAAALRGAARTAAEHATAGLGLTDDPLVADGLHGRGADPLGPRVRVLRHEAGHGGADAWPRLAALDAVRALGSTDPLTAAYKAIESARSALVRTPETFGPLREAVRHALGDPSPPVGADGAAEPDAAAPPLDRYAWITGHWLGLAARITYVRDRAPADVARAYGRDPTQSRTGPVALTDDPWMALRQDGDWTVTVEAHGDGMGHRAVMEELSAGGGEVVRAGWSARGNPHFFHVVDGRDRTCFRPGTPDDAFGDAPTALLGPLADIGLTPDDHAAQVPAMLALAERLTGVPLTPRSLDAAHLLVPP